MKGAENGVAKGKLGWGPDRFLNVRGRTREVKREGKREDSRKEQWHDVCHPFRFSSKCALTEMHCAMNDTKYSFPCPDHIEMIASTSSWRVPRQFLKRASWHQTSFLFKPLYTRHRQT